MELASCIIEFFRIAVPVNNSFPECIAFACNCSIQTVFDQTPVQAAADENLLPGWFKADTFY